METLVIVLAVAGIILAALLAILYRRAALENIQLKANEKARLEQANQVEDIALRVANSQSTKNRDEIEKTLKPLRDNLDAFRNRMEDISKDNESGRAELKQQISILRQTNQQLADDAENLANALKGDKKMQGDWGEASLERVLEQSGLEKDREYKLQPSFKQDEGRTLRPDVVIYLPDNKQIIIDAKVSLNAYVEYHNTEDPEQRADFLRQHLLAVRNHINTLSDKDYARLQELNSIEYILLFFALEPAFILALREDKSLFNQALAKRIIPVAPSTLLATLKVIHNIWRNEKRNKNAEEIARQAGAMYDKLYGFVEDIDDVGSSLDKAQQTVSAARNKLSQGRGNLVSRAERIRELGANTTKQIKHIDQSPDTSEDIEE